MNIKPLTIIGVLILLGYTTLANATCNLWGTTTATQSGGPIYTVDPTPQVYNVAFSPISVQRDAPVGTVLATVQTGVKPDVLSIYCPTGGTTYTYMTYSSTKTNISGVYSTNVPGIGIKAEMWPGNNFENPGGSWTTQGPTAYIGMQATVTLVKTGPVSSGVLNAGEIGYQAPDSSPYYKSFAINLTGATPISAIACTINNTNVTVRLEDVLGADLKAVGTTAKLKKFNVGLDCDADAKINVKLTGNDNTDTSAAGVLQLTNAGATGVAKGVGIQMLYNDAPMTLNQNVLLKTSTGGLETFEFGAQYYQTKAAVSTGSANATATLEITYQ